MLYPLGDGVAVAPVLLDAVEGVVSGAEERVIVPAVIGEYRKNEVVRNFNPLIGTVIRYADADGGWSQDEEGWHFLNAGEEFRGGWAYLPYQGESRWYAFDDGGVMLTGWYRREESVYYLNPVSDGTQGAMLTGWQFIDGNWYYFEPDPGKDQGHLYRDTVTPDGYTVDETGAWTGR